MNGARVEPLYFKPFKLSFTLAITNLKKAKNQTFFMKNRSFYQTVFYLVFTRSFLLKYLILILKFYYFSNKFDYNFQSAVS